jgi:hypothetical protein
MKAGENINKWPALSAGRKSCPLKRLNPNLPMNSPTRKLMVACGLLLSLASARADTFYTSYAAWAASVDSIVSYAIPDPAPAPYLLLGIGDGSVTYGPITYSTSSSYGDAFFYNVGSLSSGLPAVLSDQYDSTGIENILITLSTPVNAFAINYSTFFGENVTVQLSDGATTTLVNTPAFNYDTPNVLAVDADSPIYSVLLTTTDPTLNVGTVYTANANPVPEPNTIFLSTFVAAFTLGLRAWVTRTTKRA